MTSPQELGFQNWEPSSPVELQEADDSRLLFMDDPGQVHQCFLIQTKMGELLISVQDEAVRVAMQKKVGYCFAEVPRSTLEEFLTSRHYTVGDLPAAITQEPINGLNREAAAQLLGIELTQ